jgi:uncharacterized protein
LPLHRRRPIALANSDIPDGHGLLVHSCEDCACPVSRQEVDRPLPTALPAGRLVRTENLVEVPLEDGWHALFGPSGSGGVVVVDGEARRLLDLLRRPHPVADLVAAGYEPAATTAALLRLLRHGLVHEAGTPPAVEFRQSTELTAWLHITNACNLRCPYCYVHKTDDAMDRATARETIESLVRSATRNGFRSLRLKYAGGEASLNMAVLLAMHDDAVALCAGNDLTLSTVVLSNGVAISRRTARELTDRGIAVMISLDGIGAAHDAQRPTLTGAPSFTRVLRSIDTLVAAGTPPHLSITITSRNVAAVAEVVRFAVERGLTFSFNFFRDNACSAQFADLQYEEAAMIDGLRAAFAVVEELLPPWSVLGSVLDRGQLLEARQKACGVGDDYVVVDQRGRIAKCHMDLESTVGDIRTVDPVLAIRSDRLGVQNLLVEDKQGCRDCTWRHWCAGGCTIATFRATGRFDVRSPNCGIYKAIYPDAVRLEGLRLIRYATAPPG